MESEALPTIALAGAGRIASVHALAARALGIQVTHVASRQRTNAARLAAELDAEPCGYGDLPGSADLVVVTTPPALHANHVQTALKGGAGVLVEKPLCTTLKDADLLLELERNGGPAIVYAENLAFAPAVQSALAEISQLGPLRHLEVRAMQSRPDWGDFLTDGWGGGVLFDLGAHPIALCLLAAGSAKPVTVRANLEGASDHGVDEWAEVFVGFEGGLEARVVASWRDADGAWDMQAASDDGAVRLEILPTLALERNGESVELSASREGIELEVLDQLGYLAELEAAVELVRATRPRETDDPSRLDTRGMAEPAPPSGVSLGRDVLELTCAAYQSAGRGGEAVPLPFDGPRDLTPLELWRR